MRRFRIFAALAVSVPLPGEGSAQAASELTMFSRGQFKGARVAVSGPRQAISPTLTVRSVMVPPGTRWELCSGSTFSGCREFNHSDPAMVMTVRSVRPLGAILTSSESAAPGATGRGGSLRGWASEYFVSPEENGNRVQVQSATGEGIAERAHEFCRSHGWRSSGYQRLQSVGQVSYLADVLCVDNGN